MKTLLSTLFLLIAVNSALATSSNPPASLNLYFRNSAGATVKVYWKQPNGRETLYFSLRNGRTQKQQTYKGHRWVIREAKSGLVLRTTTASRTRLIQVTVRDLVSARAKSAAAKAKKQAEAARRRAEARKRYLAKKRAEEAARRREKARQRYLAKKRAEEAARRREEARQRYLAKKQAEEAARKRAEVRQRYLARKRVEEARRRRMEEARRRARRNQVTLSFTNKTKAKLTLRSHHGAYTTLAPGASTRQCCKKGAEWTIRCSRTNSIVKRLTATSSRSVSVEKKEYLHALIKNGKMGRNPVRRVSHKPFPCNRR